MRIWLAAALSFFIGIAAQAIAADRPNIVLILADDLGYNDLSCYGRRDQATPNLDRLAAEGMRFTTAYCAQPICSPSRAALLTGKCPARLHLTNYLPGRADAPSQKLLQPVMEGQLPLEELTVAEILREAGYATACIGKWHLGGASFGPREQGFDVVAAIPANTEPGAEEGSKGEFAIARAAEEFLEEHKEKEAPFFLYVAHNAPHIPFRTTAELAKKYTASFNPNYAGVIETLDASIGRILAKVESLGMKERTVVVFASDNGGLHVLESPGTPATHNTPFRAGKGYLYEGGLRVPLIVRWPGRIQGGITNETPVLLTDLMPTLLQIAGLDPEKSAGPLDGVSLFPLLTLEKGAVEKLRARALFWHFPHYTNQGGRPGGAMRNGDWKLVEDYEAGFLELFNLARDPGERENVAAREPERARGMREKLADWRRRVGAQECRLNPHFDAAAHDAIYVARDSSSLLPVATARELEVEWKPWRALLNRAIRNRRPRVTPAEGDIRLQASEAKVQGSHLRYESEPRKRTLGYWTSTGDAPSWAFEVKNGGRFEVELLYGCGTGSGGAEVIVETEGEKIPFKVDETGHFQQFIGRTIGEVTLSAGRQTLRITATTKPGAAVMDLRRVVLRPMAP
jgi:arylsulfatase A-like enzyme